MERRLYGRFRLHPFGYRASHRSRASVSKSGSRGFFSQRGPFRVCGVLYNSNEVGSNQAVSQGVWDSSKALSTSRHRSGYLYLGGRGSVLAIYDYCCLFREGVRSRYVWFVFSATFFCLLGGAYYVLQSYRFFLGYVRARSVVGALLRGTTRAFVSFWGRCVVCPIVLHYSYYHGSYEAATSCSWVVYFRFASSDSLFSPAVGSSPAPFFPV